MKQLLLLAALAIQGCAGPYVIPVTGIRAPIYDAGSKSLKLKLDYDTNKVIRGASYNEMSISGRVENDKIILRVSATPRLFPTPGVGFGDELLVSNVQPDTKYSFYDEPSNTLVATYETPSN